LYFEGFSGIGNPRGPGRMLRWGGCEGVVCEASREPGTAGPSTTLLRSSGRDDNSIAVGSVVGGGGSSAVPGAVSSWSSCWAWAGDGSGSTFFPVLLGTHPFGDIEWRVIGRRGGLVLGGESASGREAVRDQAFDGHDHLLEGERVGRERYPSSSVFCPLLPSSWAARCPEIMAPADRCRIE